MSDGLPDVEELDAKIKALSEAVGNARSAIDNLEDDLQEEREERRRLEEENEELREEIERLHARTDLLRLVERSDDMTAKERRVALIQHLKQAAEKERERNREAKASVNWKEAEAALKYPNIARETVYTDLRKAPGLVGNKDLLWYESSSGGESRLKLNLENGSLSAEITGVETEVGNE